MNWKSAVTIFTVALGIVFVVISINYLHRSDFDFKQAEADFVSHKDTFQICSFTFPLVAAAIAIWAVRIAMKNLNTTQTKNSRDATFTMLQRWNSDKIAEARAKVIQEVDKYNERMIANAVNLLATVRIIQTQNKCKHLREGFFVEFQNPKFAGIRNDSHYDFIKWLAALPFNSDLDYIQGNRSLFVEREIDTLLTASEHLPRYRALILDTSDAIFEVIRDFALTNKDEEHYAKATSTYYGTDDSLIDLSEHSNISEPYIKVAQVISEIHALLVDGVLDAKLVSSLFGYTFKEWEKIVSILYNSKNSVQNAWLETQVKPFPKLLHASGTTR